MPPTATLAYYGLVNIAAGNAAVTYVEIDPAGAGTFQKGGTYDYAYASAPPGFTLSIDGIVVTATAQRTATAVDGTWVGLNNGAYETLEINKGLYRVYRVGSGGQALMGCVDMNNTHLHVRYGFSPQISGLKNTILELRYMLSGDGNTLTVTIAPGFDITYHKALVPPAARRIAIRLDTTFASWNANKTSAYLSALASALSVSVTQLDVQDVREGSVILDVIVIDDQTNGKTAQAQFDQIRNTPSIGGYTILSVSEVAPPARNAAASLLPSLLVAALAALLALWLA
jgi:hypothetical protein